MTFIDTHCHLYDEVFQHNIDEIYNNCLKQKVEQVLLPNIDFKSMDAMTQLMNIYPNWVKGMLGLHPCYVNKDWESTVKDIFSSHNIKPYIAVGEIGLDNYHSKEYFSEQINALHVQIEKAVELQLPIVLHTRNAVKETLNIVQQYRSSNITGVFHCFSEGFDVLDDILDLGFYVGIGGVITFKNNILKNMFHQIPMERIILETDAPYLSPHPYRGKTNSPTHIPLIAEHCAKLKNVTIEQLASQTTENAKKLFGL